MTIDRSVRAVRPSWRADSLALAYVAAGGKAVVYDLSHQSRRVVGPAGPVTHVSFGPPGTRLALAGTGAGIGWLEGARAIASGSEVRLDRSPKLVLLPPLRLGGRISRFDANGSTFAAAVDRAGTRIIAGGPNGFTTVLSLPAPARVQAVVVR
jgi:hypothetical protein